MFSELNYIIQKWIWMLIIQHYFIGLNRMLMLKSFVLWNSSNIFYKPAKNFNMQCGPATANDYMLKPLFCMETIMD